MKKIFIFLLVILFSAGSAAFGQTVSVRGKLFDKESGRTISNGAITKKIFFTVLISSFVILMVQCEGKERYYRPDLPEQLCAIGIIDIDDTIYYDTYSPLRPPFIPRDSMAFSRSIYFEKSFQTEYPDVINDSLREFSFGISNDEKEIIFYKNKLAGKNFEYKISDSISFESGRKYFFHAREKETPDISAEIMVPKPPPELSLISLKTGILILDKPNDYRCSLGGVDKFIRRTAEIEFSFSNINPDSYYAVLLIGSYSDSRVDWSPGWGSNLIEFNILECNTNGFFFHLHDRKTIQKFKNRMFNYCGDIVRLRQLSSTYFIDPGRIPYCTLKISTYWDYERFIPGYIKCFRIRLMSISKETYLFYKSLYTFNTQKDDPFSELVNINGNIVGGNGIIALCRSRELIVYTDQTGGRYDPFF